MQKIKHLAIIMDGNRRWAHSKGLPTLLGHKEGYKKIVEIGQECLKRGIKVLTVYAFSTENWKRPEKEVDYLMSLLRLGIQRQSKKLNKDGIKMRFLGRIMALPVGLQKTINKAVELTRNNKKGVLNIALNYGGHTEIVDACRNICILGTNPSKIDEKMFDDNLYTSGLPPVDFLIRTGGERRLSNFLLWQLSYAELYFTDTYWPDFSTEHLDMAISDYNGRERRRGK